MVALRDGQDHALRARVLEFLRSRTDDIVERWVAEVTSAPYTRIADFSLPKEARISRLKRCFAALLELAAKPNDAVAREMLRMDVRSEQLRSMGLVKMVSNQHALRYLLVDLVEAEYDGAEEAFAKALVEQMVDMCVEETAILVEQYVEAQRVLSRFSWDPQNGMADAEQVHAAFCRNAMEYFDADMVALFRLNPEAKELVCISCFAKGMGISRNTRIHMRTLPIAARAVSDARPISCLDMKDERKVRLVGSATVKHCVAVPLMRDGDVMGIMFVGDNSRAHDFSSEEVAMAEELARLVVGALESAEMLRELSFRSRAQKALIETAANMQKEIDSGEIYRILATKLLELIPSHEVAFYVFDWQRNVGNPVYATGPYAAETMADRDFPADVGVVGAVARSRRAEIIPDTEMDERAEVIPDTPATHTAMLAVPLLGRKEVLGVIELLRYLPEGYAPEELEIASMFASHASVALENARLLNEMRHVRDEIELHMDLLTHDIANYSTPLLGYLESLRAREPADEATGAAIDRSMVQVESIARMIGMVRTLAKLRSMERGELRRMDMRVAIDDAVRAVGRYRISDRLEVSVDLEHDEMPVMADELLPELFSNMFFTAVRPDRRDRVQLVIREDHGSSADDVWWIRVTHPERHIPDRLKREILRVAKASKSELTGGFGIGLASARGIAERYNGKLWITDVNPADPSEGSVFNVKIPKAR